MKAEVSQYQIDHVTLLHKCSSYSEKGRQQIVYPSLIKYTYPEQM